MSCPLGSDCETTRDMTVEELEQLLEKYRKDDNKRMDKCVDELERRLNVNSVLSNIPILGLFLDELLPTNNLSNILGTYISERKLLEAADFKASITHGIAEQLKEAVCPICNQKSQQIRLLPCTPHACCQDCAQKTPRNCPDCKRFYHDAQKFDVRLGTCTPSCVAMDAHRNWCRRHYSGVAAADETFPLVYTLGLGIIGGSLFFGRFNRNFLSKFRPTRFF